MLGILFASAKFQSSPSLRTATVGSISPARSKQVSILAVLADGDPASGAISAFVEVSIHAVLADGDRLNRTVDALRNEFQSTPSLRTATIPGRNGDLLQDVSIHAVLADGDGKRAYFSPAILVSIHAVLADGDGELLQ